MKIYKKDCEFCPLAFCVQHSSISLASPFFYSSSAERRTRDLGSSAERVSRPPALIHTQHARRRRKNNRKEKKKCSTHMRVSRPWLRLRRYRPPLMAARIRKKEVKNKAAAQVDKKKRMEDRAAAPIMVLSRCSHSSSLLQRMEQHRRWFRFISLLFYLKE